MTCVFFLIDHLILTVLDRVFTVYWATAGIMTMNPMVIGYNFSSRSLFLNRDVIWGGVGIYFADKAVVRYGT